MATEEYCEQCYCEGIISKIITCEINFGDDVRICENENCLHLLQKSTSSHGAYNSALKPKKSSDHVGGNVYDDLEILLQQISSEKSNDQVVKKCDVNFDEFFGSGDVATVTNQCQAIKNNSSRKVSDNSIADADSIPSTASRTSKTSSCYSANRVNDFNINFDFLNDNDSLNSPSVMNSSSGVSMGSDDSKSLPLPKSLAMLKKKVGVQKDKVYMRPSYLNIIRASVEKQCKLRSKVKDKAAFDGLDINSVKLKSKSKATTKT